MGPQGIVSSVALGLGVVILVVLVSLGGVAKKRVEDGVVTRLEYDLPDGAKDNPDFRQCYRATKGMFFNEYFLWNLTNLAAVESGAKPIYNLTGPWTYTPWYCNYDFHVDEDAGYLRYRTIKEGFKFLPDDSVSDDSVLITNVNPAYVGILQQAESEFGLTMLMTSGALEQIITAFQDATLIRISGASTVLTTINQQVRTGLTPAVTAGVAAGTLGTIATTVPSFVPDMFFAPSFQALGFKGWANYTLENNASAPVSLPSGVPATIFATWTAQSGRGLLGFVSSNASTIASTYGVGFEQANALLVYGVAYLLNKASYTPGLVDTQIQGALLGQWANASVSTTSLVAPLPVWELGLPTASGVSIADANLLFTSTNNCSLTNSTGMQTWASIMAGQRNLTDACPGVYTLTTTQVLMIRQWLSQFLSTTVDILLRQQFGNVANWNDFSYGQWGSQLAGRSLRTPTMTFTPEIYNFDYTTVSPLMTRYCVTYTIEEARSVLNGTRPLFKSDYMREFLGLIKAQDFDTITSLWPVLDQLKAACLGGYLAGVLAPFATRPKLQELIGLGGGMFVTRTARQWLFDAQDPLLTALNLDSDVSLIGNTTQSKVEADALNYTYVRIYTGRNDLHWSLMPSNEGELLDFWRGDVRITGYNGSQFLPHGYLDQSEPNPPLDLFHPLINRTIRFVNAGSDTWQGVDVRYLTLHPDTLKSQAENPANYAYFAEYSGVINKTSNPPYLPVFLSTPDFRSAEPKFYENVTFIDEIFTDYDPNEKLSRHRLSLFLLSEPTLGTSLWGNLPIQINFRIGPTDIFYRNVTNTFAPIYFYAIGNIATSNDLDDIKDVLYVGQRAWKILIGVGVGAGVICMVGGIIGIFHYKKYKHMKNIPSSPSTTTVTSTESSLES